MSNSFSNLNNLLPNLLTVKNAEGDRLIADNNTVFYNYFNESLRWLCGYNNRKINSFIEEDIEIIQKNPDHIIELDKFVKKSILEYSGYNYKNILFFENNVYSELQKYLVKGQKKYFFTLGDVRSLPDLNDNYLSFEKLLELEPENKSKKKTKEGWSLKSIKRIFQRYRGKLAGLVISPILLTQKRFLNYDTADYLIRLCKKFKIPVLWDESLTCFFRSHSFLLLHDYDVIPDFVIINSNIYENKNVHLLISTKKAFKKYLKKAQPLESTKNAISLIVIHSIFKFLEESQLDSYIERISLRLTKKLKALSANINGRFTYKAKGLIIILKLDNEYYYERLKNYFIQRRIIVLPNIVGDYLLIPQLTISERAVDLFIQVLDDFFKNGIKIKPSKK